MKYPNNIDDLDRLPIDMMGMIFYEKSPRFADTVIPKGEASKDRVGVFVNADIDAIKKNIDTHSLDFVQLHGNESPSTCEAISKLRPVIKAFSIAEKSDFAITKEYEGVCKYFLFDTKTPQYGGSGKKFDWQILNTYQGNTPFLLSGGITSEDASSIKAIDHPQFLGVDLNSKFEVSPGLKDIALLEKFIKELRYEQD